MFGGLIEVNRGVSDSVLANEYNTVSHNLAMSLYFIFILSCPFGLYTS